MSNYNHGDLSRARQQITSRGTLSAFLKKSRPPLHTKRDRWVEQALEHFCDGDGAETMERIYDALKSGKLKVPEVE